MRAIFVFLLFIQTGHILFAQSHVSKEEFSKSICKKWKMVEVELDGVKIPDSEIGENFMEFDSTGAYKVFEQGETYAGKWSFDSESQELLTDDRDGKGVHKIIKLTESELILLVTDSNGTTQMKFEKK